MGVAPEAYVAAFARVQEHLRAGNSYEVNLTYRLSAEADPDPVATYLRLRDLNPAPYAGCLQHDVEGHRAWLLSSSPERYALVTADRTIETKPIKGTAPRGATAEEDDALRDELARDPKNRAENLMIVDLLRNDIGMVSEVGSVEVPVLMDVESYESVHQLVSTVRGRLRDDVTTVGALRALFPPGSMTGAPKRRTMEVIEEVEETPRGVYAGAFGWISGDGRADLGVVIRSLMTSGDGRWTLGTGGGITVRSDVEDEWLESRWKAERLLRAPSTRRVELSVAASSATEVPLAASERDGSARSPVRPRPAARPAATGVSRVPPPGRVGDGHPAAVAVHDLPHDRQPEARAGHRPGLVGAPEALEDVRLVLGRDAGPLVVDREHPGGEADGDGAACGAPLRGVVEQVEDRPLQPGGIAGDPPVVEAHVELDAGRAAADPGQGPLGDVGQVDRLDDRGRLVLAGEDDQVPDEGGELLDLGAYVVEQLAAGLLREAAVPLEWAPSAWASRSRLVRREVSGVRSSWPASATSRRCRSRDAASEVSIWLKAAASRAISSSPSTASGARSSVTAIRSTERVRRRTGRRPLAATAHPARAAASTPSPPETSMTVPSLARVRCCDESGWASTSAASLPAGTVATRYSMLPAATMVRTESLARPAATSSSGRPRVISGPSSAVRTPRSEVMKMMRTSAAPSIHEGTSRRVISDRAVYLAAFSARSSSDSSRLSCSCIRITMKAPSDISAMDTATASVVRTATREASERR